MVPKLAGSGSKTIDRAENRKRQLRVLATVEQVQAQVQELEQLHQEFSQTEEEAKRALSIMEQTRDQLFRNFADNNEALRQLINDRDRIKAMRLYQSDKRAKELVAREVGVGLRSRDDTTSRSLNELEARAARLFGIKVSADQFEILAVKSRRLSQDELALLARIAEDAVGIEDLLKQVLAKNTNLLEREVAARQTLERYAGVNFDSFPKTGPIGQLAARVHGAIETFRQYDKMLKQRVLALENGINAMQQVKKALDGVGEGATAEDLVSVLRYLGPVGIIGGALAASGGAGLLGGVAAGVGIAATLLKMAINTFDGKGAVDDDDE